MTDELKLYIGPTKLIKRHLYRPNDHPDKAGYIHSLCNGDSLWPWQLAKKGVVEGIGWIRKTELFQICKSCLRVADSMDIKRDQWAAEQLADIEAEEMAGDPEERREIGMFGKALKRSMAE